LQTRLVPIPIKEDGRGSITTGIPLNMITAADRLRKGDRVNRILFSISGLPCRTGNRDSRIRLQKSYRASSFTDFHLLFCFSSLVSLSILNLFPTSQN
jgi:hypothetical protein